MKGYIVGMLAETSVHAGAGQSQGVIDLPVAREETTGYPMIPGSSLKGSLRDKVEQEIDKDKANQFFGVGDSEARAAGNVGITDARLLLLPVRSLTGHYRWATCPYLLERLQRDLKLVGKEEEFPSMEKIASGKALVAQEISTLFLEEFSFSTIQAEETIQKVAEILQKLIPHQSVRQRLVEQLVILNDEEFAYFARYGLAVRARNQLDDQTKESKNLWYEETLPPDSLMYLLLIGRNGKKEDLEQLKEHLDNYSYLQVGGNETMGQGWFFTSIWE